MISVRSLRSGVLGLALWLAWMSCQTRPAPGDELARTYCGSCHLTPAPTLLDRAAWQRGVLPQMALRLGFVADSSSLLAQQAGMQQLARGIQLGVFPAQPAISRADWRRLADYYLRNAPETQPKQPAHAPISPDLTLFRPRRPAQFMEALTTVVQFDSVRRRIWAGNRRGWLYQLDAELRPQDSVNVGSAPAYLWFGQQGERNVLTMGRMDPNDDRTGAWRRYGAATAPAYRNVVADSLRRPVHAAVGDLNADGRPDVVLSQFGHLTGRLSWFENPGHDWPGHAGPGHARPGGPSTTYQEHPFREHVLDAVPGARQSYIDDINRDGRADVVALLTQGDEQVAAYLAQPDGTFRKQTLLRFPPVYGSSYIDYVDLDNDGDRDLLYANGDNADYSYGLKPYHGIRIFRNEGGLRFRQTWFYPLYGATQALARDFDQDGDIDVVATAFFPDFDRQPTGSLVYFENQQNAGRRSAGRRPAGRYVPRTLPEAETGRWLTMQAADVDQDGDLDLLLGSFYYSVSPTPFARIDGWQRGGTGVLLLENRLN